MGALSLSKSLLSQGVGDTTTPNPLHRTVVRWTIRGRHIIIKATPRKDRLTAQHVICLHLFRQLCISDQHQIKDLGCLLNLAQKFLDIRQYARMRVRILFEHEWYAGIGFKPACVIKQSDEKSAAHLTHCPLCGVT